MSSKAAAAKATTKNADIHYTTRGQGPTCLVLTGIGTKPYERQMPASLSDQLRLVFVDLRGSGRSGGAAAELDFDLLADDLEAVRAALGVARVAVLGHSILGLAALEYGRRRPASVSHVIAVGAPPKGDMRWLVAEGKAFFDEDASPDRKAILARNLAALPPGAPPAAAVMAQTPMRFFDPGFDAAPLFAGAETRPEFLAHLLGTLAPAWDVTAGAGTLTVPITVPILLAHGRHDYVVPHRLWDAVVPTLPDATFRLFERSGHQPFVEEPERFTTVVTDWMRGAP
jgi:proline iminopeptidase